MGHWEKDTLVIETIRFRDDLWLDVRGDPDQLRENDRADGRPDFGTIEIELTVNDPKAYTKPWTVKLDARAVSRR